jgi:hypothetical protein
MPCRHSLAIAALSLALLAGCGGGSNDTTVTQTVATPESPTGTGTGTVTVPEIGPPKDDTQTDSPQQTPPEREPPESGGTRSEAVAKLRDEGYRPDDASDYDSSATLRVLIGTRLDSGDGYAKRAFFFVGGRYIGTDTSEDSAQMRVENASDDTVTLAYALYGPDDALCCPGGTATVRYQWNGSRLVPLDPIPPRSRRG